MLYGIITKNIIIEKLNTDATEENCIYYVNCKSLGRQNGRQLIRGIKNEFLNYVGHTHPDVKFWKRTPEKNTCFGRFDKLIIRYVFAD